MKELHYAMGRVHRNKFGDQIRFLRLSHELTQEAFAEKVGLHSTYVGGIERGERNISLDNIFKIAAAFDLSISELFEYEILTIKDKPPNTEVSKRDLHFLEEQACIPIRPQTSQFNKNTILPYGLTGKHIEVSMNEFIDFIGFINQQLHTKSIERLETMLMPANFSSIVGEFMTSAIPKHCSGLVKNAYHNGHPDMIPAGMFPDDKLQHGTEGIEVKGSRYLKAWQGHNAEDAWLMVFCFESSRPSDEGKGILPMPFRFIKVVGAQLTKDDWKFAGKSTTSRRTITASVTSSGYEKMMDNWIFMSE